MQNSFEVEDWLAPSVVRWPDAVLGPWAVTLRWRAAGDRAECAGIGLDAVDADLAEPVSSTLLRTLPLARLIATARQDRYREAGGDIVDALTDGAEVDVGIGLADAIRVSSRPWTQQRDGRPLQLDQEFYQQVAQTYSQALAAGDRPLLAVIERWTTSRPTASRWVAAARAAGLLPATERGIPKGNDFPLNNTTTKEKHT